MARAWNLFRIGRRGGDEDQLTEMLVWLASAVPAVRSGLVEFALGTAADPEDISVSTQYSIAGVGRLDALVDGPGFRLVIESKLASDYGDDQVGRYLRWLASHASDDRTSALMTLTARSAPWPQADTEYAADNRIVSAPRRWEELHALLEPLTVGEDALTARVVREFLDMLADEDLVPVPPLSASELGTAWADAWALVRRYREFFHACKEAVAGALAAEVVPNSWSDRGDGFWQDYALPDGTRVVIGLLHTDEQEKITSKRREPIVWAGVKADHLDDWESVRLGLGAEPPAGWREGNVWYGRPTIWRPLRDLVSPAGLEEQVASVAVAAAEVKGWVDAALASR